MVFEGGGAKGMAFVGAMQALEERGITFDRLLGTSAGAITATCLAAGYDSREMLAVLSETVGEKPVFATFLEIPPLLSADEIKNGDFTTLLRAINLPLVGEPIEEQLDRLIIKQLQEKDQGRQFLSFIERGGLYAADNFIAWLERNLDRGNFQGQPRRFSKMSLQQFFDVTEVDLTLAAADISDSRLLFLNHRTAPDCPLVYAVRMSMSVPLVWPEVVWKAEWGNYAVGHRTLVLTGHAVVDGGLLSNFPIELLISNDPHILAVMGPQQQRSDLNDHVLGLLIDESLELPESRSLSFTEAVAESQAIRRIKGLVNATTQAHDKMVIESFEDFIVRLPAWGYGTLEFEMSEEKKSALIEAGYQATKEHLGNRDSVRGTQPREPQTANELANVRALNLLER